jgi:PAS domain S-box-containing protein
VHGRRIVHGGKIGVLGTLIDVSERKRAEESLRESEAYLTEAQRLSHTGSWALDVASNRYLYTSEEFDRIFGLDPDREELTREAILERMHPEDRISWKRILEKSVREKLDTTSQYRIVLPDGSIRHIHTIRHPVVNSAGEVVKLVGTSIDITERKRAEEELRASHAAVRESEQRYRTLFEKANDALFLENDRDDIVEVNERACTLLGYSRDQLLKMKVPDLQAPEIRGQAGRVIREEIDKHGNATFESVDLHCSGRRIPVEVTNTEISDRGEKLVLSIVRDITERKRAEETLRQNDYSLRIAREELARVSRVTTLGELTASIAHEVNQPLGAMVANAAACTRWLAADPPATSKAQRALESIAADGRRASEIIGRIRALVKRQAPRKDLVDVNLKIAQVIELAADEIRRNGIVLRTALAEGLPRVEGDRVQLQQVLLNLILNAVDAMSPIRDRPREVTLASRREGEQDVLIEVRDTGPGIDPDSAERLFEPFYTTKAQGLGMGLSISRSIVEAHGGRLWAGSNQPHGAVFRFSLPVAGRRDHESCIGS